jgi:hypothetical protein
MPLVYADDQRRLSESDLKELGVAAADECTSDPREEIKTKFLVAMPEDFFEFWEFAKSVNAKRPSGWSMRWFMWIAIIVNVYLVFLYVDVNCVHI